MDVDYDIARNETSMSSTSTLVEEPVAGCHKEDGEFTPFDRHDDYDSGSSSGRTSRRRSISEDRRGAAYVELYRKEGQDLGLIISGGVDRECRPCVSYLRPGGIAQRSDAVEIGDYILSINGIKAAMLQHDEMVSLLKNSGKSVVLEVEYELPEPPQSTFSVLCKHIEVNLERDGSTFGFTLRGGVHPEPSKCRPLTVTQIRPGSITDREGTLKIGDRILAINGINVTQSSLEDALSIVKHTEDELNVMVEYDVSVLEAVQNATGPLLVEIDKTPGDSLGIELATTSYKGNTVFCINRIKSASIADRCGALHCGDHILSIDDTSLEHMTVAEATSLLKCSIGEQIRLEILPVSGLREKSSCSSNSSSRSGLLPVPYKGSKENLTLHQNHSSSCNSVSSLNSHATYNSMTTQMGSAIAPPCGSLSRNSTLATRQASLQRNNTNHQVGGWGHRRRKFSDSIPPVEVSQPYSESDPHYQTQLSFTGSTASMQGSNGGYGTLTRQNQPQVCHTDTTEVVVHSNQGKYCFMLEPGEFSCDILTEPPIICNVEPRGPADRTGVIQDGDRLLAIDGIYLENKTMEEANQMLKDCRIKAILTIEFDVAESIVPSSGIFVVKLAKRGSTLGITISSPRNRKQGEPLIISDVKKGSVAHRTGTIQPGDKLLGIDNMRTDNCTLDDAAQVLQDIDEIVKLKIHKDETFADEPDPSSVIMYTVELPKFGGPLGITISGTEEPFDPIFISSMAEGGLAEKTGALHVGDRLLAINGQSLRGRPLTDAIHHLQNAGNTVTLKITRPANRQRKEMAGKSHDSVDSALESWDSSGLDSNGNSKPSSRQKSQDTQGEGSTSSHSGSHTSSGQSGSHSSGHHSDQSQRDSHVTYIDLDHLDPRWDTRSPSCVSDGGAPSCSSSTDEWSKRLDELDNLHQGDIVNDAESDITDFPLSSGSGQNTVKRRPPASNTSDTSSNPNSIKENMVVQETADDVSEHASVASSKVTTAEMHLKEVEEQLQNIFTPTPVELLRVTLYKHPTEDFGFGLSDGVYEKGVYISALRPTGPAERSGALKPYDRILQVNRQRTKDFDCCQVVPMIGSTGDKVELVISRNPLATSTLDLAHTREHEQDLGDFEFDDDGIWELQAEDISHQVMIHDKQV